jgi:hypothetical protein
MQRYIRLNLCPGGIALEGSEKCGAGYTAESNYKNEFRSRDPPKRTAGRFLIRGPPRREEKKAKARNPHALYASIFDGNRLS